MSEFWKRLLSGIVYVGVIVGSLVAYPHPLFFYLTTVLVFITVGEFHTLTKSGIKNYFLCSIAATVMCFLSNAIVTGNLREASWYCAVYFALIIYAVVSEVFHPNEKAIETWGKILGSQVMIALPFALMNVIVARSQWLMLALFVIVWMNDTGAYCIGSLMSKRPGGNHKMAPLVSPAKSWEGLIGGLISAVITAGVFSIWVSQWSLWQWLLMGLLIGIAATLGDLTESLMKRVIGVKDSGRFMPGHGGALDRFDSMLLVVPVVFIIILIM